MDIFWAKQHQQEAEEMAKMARDMTLRVLGPLFPVGDTWPYNTNRRSRAALWQGYAANCARRAREAMGLES